MRKYKTLAAAMLTIAVAFAFTPFFGIANAAEKKKSVHVVSYMNINFESEIYKRTSEGNVKYNKKGLVTAYTGATTEYAIKYNKDYTVKQLKTKPLIPGVPAAVKTFAWKKGKLVKTVEKSEGYTWTTKYKYKGKKIVKTDAINDAGDNNKTRIVYSYTYKKNHISKEKGSIDKAVKLDTGFTFDKNGNVKTIKALVYGEKGVTANVYAYDKNKNPRRITSTYTVEEKAEKRTTVSKLKFKTMKVPAKYCNMIKEQQWKLINCSDGNSDGISFAW